MTDIALIRRWHEIGDAQAFNEIASLYAPMVYGACVRILGNAHDAQDAAQDCFLTLAQTKKLPRDHFPAWLHVVASNCARKLLRSEHRRRERELQFTSRAAKYSEATWDEISAHIDEAIAALDPELGSLIVSHFLQGQSQTELANKLGLSRQTVTHRIGRATEQIRASLKKKGLITTTAALAAHIAANTADAAPASLAVALGKIALAGPSTSVAAGSSWLGWITNAKVLSGIAACAIGIVALSAYVATTTSNDDRTSAQSNTANLGDANRSQSERNTSKGSTAASTETLPARNVAVLERGQLGDVQAASERDSAGGFVSGTVELPDGKPFAGAEVSPNSLLETLQSPLRDS